MTTSPNPTEAEKVVAEWRAAMEGVTPGPWRPSRFGFQVVSDYPEPAWQSVVELTTVARSEPNVEREMLTQKAIANWLARCSPSGISDLLALIESQRATIERVRAAVGDFAKPTGGDLAAAVDLISMRCATAEARATVLEAENKRITSDREYVIGFNAGWDEAVAQTLRFPTMLRKMWSGGEVQKWIDEAMTAARQALSLSSTEVKNDDL